MEEKIISIDTRTLQSISDKWIRDKDMWMQHNGKESYRFWCKVNDCKLRPKVVKAELLFSGFLVKRDLPLSTAYHAVKLFMNMFPDSKIMNKYRCHRTKTATYMLTRAVAKQLLATWKRVMVDSLLLISNRQKQYEDDRFLAVLVRHVDKDSGLAAASLLEVPNTQQHSKCVVCAMK